MSAATVDYDALAQQHGGAPTSVDYDALASQHGGTSIPVDNGTKSTEQPGFLSALGSDIKGAVSNALTPTPSQLGMEPLGQKPAPSPISQVAENFKARKAAGNSLPYRATAAVNEALGVNVKGMEESATQGDPGGVLGHAAAVPTIMAVTAAAAKLPPALKTALSTSGVTSEMAAKLHTSLDTVAKDAGLPKSTETSLSGKSADTVKGLKGQAQKIYGDLDKASGGRYQRFVDEIDEIQDAMKNKYTNPQDAIKLKSQLAQVQADYAAVQKQLVSRGIDPKIIAKGDVKWAQAKALEAVGKKFKTAESLSGELKPGTSSVDTGLKNLKDHILPQATKGEAAGIKSTVIDATNKLSKVKRNQTIAKVAAGAVGAGGLAYGLKGKP